MKTSPIYILLIIFFLNFDIAWGEDIIDTNDYNIVCLKSTEYPHYFGFDYSLSSFNNIYLQSMNFTFVMFNDMYIKDNILHRLRAGIGLSHQLYELDYELGYSVKIFKPLFILPYLDLGFNYFAFAYGGGLEFQYIFNSFYLTTNIYNRNTEKLFGHTDAQQWYQSGFGAKIGITTSIR